MPNIANPAQPKGNCPWPPLVTAAGCLLALAIALFLLPTATYTAKVPHDILGYFDVTHRLGMGQQPHVDYHTPIGWLAYGLPWLGHLALGQFAAPWSSAAP